MNSKKHLTPSRRESPKNCRNGETATLDENYHVPEQLEQCIGVGTCKGNDGDGTSDNVNDDFGKTYDDDDDDDLNNTRNSGPLWLGFLEKPKNKSCFLHQFFPSKAGGTPVWLDPLHLPTGRSFVCGFCEEPLRFVLQVYAPIIESEFAYHRTIFVFMCPSMSCLRRDQLEQQKHTQEELLRSVKVFRCQLPLVNPFYDNKNQSNNGSVIHPRPEAALCSWCGTWKGDQLCSGCRKIRYCSRNHQVLHWRSSHKYGCKQSSNTSFRNGESAPAKMIGAASNTLWPEYEILLEERSKSCAPVSDCNDSHSSLASIQGKNGTTESMLEYFEADEEKKSLAFFLKHTDEDPDQVLRCWITDGKPLWPELRGRPSTINIPKCSHCHGPMRFEFQILPQLLFYFHVENEVESLDWATIAIYTCEASCDSVVVYKEEFPWVQLYS